MKSRILTNAILIASLTLTPQAHAQSGFEATWVKVKVTVKKWWEEFNGSPTAPPAAQPVAKPAQTPAPPAPGAATAGQASTPKPLASATTPTPAPRAAVPTKAKLDVGPRPEMQVSMPTKTVSLKDVQSARDRMRQAQVLQVSKPGRPATTPLAKTKAGVATIDWQKLKVTKKVPRLDIGTENQISRSDFQVDSLNWTVGKPSDMKALPSPTYISQKEVTVALKTPVTKVTGPKGFIANMKTVGQPISREAIDKIQYVFKDVPVFKPLPLTPISEEHLKMVAALILFEKGNSCHMIMGLFQQLAQTPKTKAEATYHLGACADQLSMHQAAYDKLSSLVASEDKEFGADALKLLAKDLPLIYEVDFYKTLKNAKSHKSMITDDSRDDVTYRMAKGAYRQGDYKTSLVYADQVSEKADYYEDARFLSGMNSFALGDKAGSLKKLETLMKAIEARKLTKSNIHALAAVNLARMYFAQKKYDKALEYYMQVPKDHALWVQALIEQGWTQLAIEDYSGAIGNMYSLHSPYFKAVYQPESFVVRTIGYLNICQYGDAYKTLSWLEKDYREWFAKTDQYLTSHKQPHEIYSTVKTYIKGKSDQSIEGVPYQVWREIARRKDFLNLQTALNDKLDETKRYEGVNEKIKTEKAGIRAKADASKRRFDDYKAKVAQKKSDYADELKREKELTIGYRFQLAILEQSRQGYLDFQKQGQTKLDKETFSLSTKAGDTLMRRATSMRTEMNRVLENNEFLRYEVFSGSGENIRYQVAGGEVDKSVNRVPAHVKPTKMMNWSFDGEFWEDEIGSYRSSLQNNCPVSATSPSRQDGDHARLGN